MDPSAQDPRPQDPAGPNAPPGKPRPRELGIPFGPLPTGPKNALTDVAGVRVGHATVVRGEDVRTGVTVILPHGGNPFAEKVPAAIGVMNGFGKLAGSTQVDELGELESPIALTTTLCVPRAADGLLDWLLALPGNEDVRSANVVVGETNDGGLNDGRGRHVTAAHVAEALRAASGPGGDGAFARGCAGAGTGTVCFGWKGGIGTASRRAGGHTVGVLVQTNFGGALTIAGVPVHASLSPRGGAGEPRSGGGRDGSCMIVLATDAPLDANALRRLAARAFAGMARTGASFSHGSGDYAIAFSTAPELRIRAGSTTAGAATLRGDALTPLFAAAADATEEAIVDSLFAAETTTGNGRTVQALPAERAAELVRAARQR